MDFDKWEDVDSMGTSSGVMVSNLPLVFAHGIPTSLKAMTLSELEQFVPFMVRCSVGEDLKISWSQLPRPIWWPNKLPFRLPSCSSSSATKNVLVKLIERCYAFHGCQYLLQFCQSLHQLKPSSGYRFTDNRDGTTSMYHGNTGKLLVTFRNENRDYDKATLKPNRQLSSPKKLLPITNNQRSNKNGAMVRPPVSDVFLCDKCDDEFTSLKEVQAHEKHCKGDKPLSPKLPSPEPELIEDDEISYDQVPFLSYLGLKPSEHTGLLPYTSPRKKQTPLVKRPISQSYIRFDTIDISSPLGRYILSNCKYSGKLQMPQQQVSRYERHIYASPDADQISTRERSTNRWIVVWRPRREEQPWSHLYCFNSNQKREKEITLKTGLDKRSRMLLSKCKQPRVKLKRLAKRVIDRATRLGGRSAPCIDLTASEDCGSSSFGRVAQPPPFTNSYRNSLSSVEFLNENAGRPQLPVPDLPFVEVPPAADPCQSEVTFPLQSYYHHHHHHNTIHNDDMSGLSDPLSLVSNYGTPNSVVSPSPAVSSLVPVPRDGGLLKERPPLEEVDDLCKFKLKNLTNNGVTVSTLVSSDSTLLPQSSRLVNVSNLPGKIHNPSSSNSSLPSYLNLVPNQSSIPSGSSFDNSKHIEVIDLSSDEEEVIRDTRSYAPSASTNEYSYSKNKDSNRSYARSKNGCSHWSLCKDSVCGRDQSDLVTNGATPRSVPPQPPTSSTHPSSHPHSLSSPPFHLSDSLKGKLNQYIKKTVNTTSVLSKEKGLINPFKGFSFFRETESDTKGNSEMKLKYQELIESVEGVLPIRAPVQIDDEVSFNIYTPKLLDYLRDQMNCSVFHENFEDKDLINNNNNNSSSKNSNCYESESKSKGIISNITSKLNEGLTYLSNFVKHKVRENWSPADESTPYDDVILDSSDVILLEKDGKSTDQNDNFLGDEKRTLNKVKKSYNPVKNLLKDECLELERLGIRALMNINSENSNLTMTRCRAEETISDLTRSRTRKRKRFENPVASEIQQSGKSLKSYPRNNLLPKLNCDLARSTHGSQEGAVTESKLKSGTKRHLSGRKINESNEQKVYSGGSETCDVLSTKVTNVSSPNLRLKRIKDAKLSRELKSLYRDECKELRDEGFHPSNHISCSEGESCRFRDFIPCVLPLPIATLGIDQGANPTELDIGCRAKDEVVLDEVGSYSNENFDFKLFETPKLSCATLSGGHRKPNLKRIKMVKIPRELKNLSLDECKELRNKGFHPSHILGDSAASMLPHIRHDRSLSITSPGENSLQDTVLKTEESIRDEMKTSLYSKAVSCDSDTFFCGDSESFSCSFTNKLNQGQVKSGLKMTKSIKLPRELQNLSRDECKELKARGFHPLDILADSVEKQDQFVPSESTTISLHPPSQVGTKYDIEGITENTCDDKADSVESRTSNYAYNSSYTINSDPYKLLSTSSSSRSNKKSKRIKRVKVSRELKNLSRDECKELRAKGFHPSDILGGSVESPDQIHLLDEDLSSPSPVLKRSSLISFKNKKRNEISSFKCNDSIAAAMIQGNKKLSNELSRLMKDEWKELKRSGCHPSQISSLLSVQRSFRSTSGGEAKRKLNLNVNYKGSNFSLGKSTRMQEKAESAVRRENPRLTHRDIIKTENSMCVLNYTVDNLT